MTQGRRRSISDGLPEGMFARVRQGKTHYYMVDQGSQIGLGTDPARAFALMSAGLAKKMSRPNPPHRLLNWGEVLDVSLDVTSYCGIYFLIKDIKIVYVGKSLNVIRRIGQHPDKSFDRFAWVLCKPEQLDHLERDYINQFSPPLNVMSNAKKQVNY